LSRLSEKPISQTNRDSRDGENFPLDRYPSDVGRYIFLRKGRGILAYEERENHMAIRKSALKSAPARPELDRLLQKARETGVTDEQLFEQRISFVYGNAPENSGITKETARSAANSVLMRSQAK
jgi:hypothetical protein